MATIETITVGENSFNTATGVPIGTIISLMGTQAPAQYLACEGQTVNIASFPDLADYFEAQFGTKNHFGGDGTTTFAVPDLRGEFLRGTGTNGHNNEGSGSAVGTHQASTKHMAINTAESNQIQIQGKNVGTSRGAQNTDYIYMQTPPSKWLGVNNPVVSSYDGVLIDTYFTSRPTNTSILYCIKAFN